MKRIFNIPTIFVIYFLGTSSSAVPENDGFLNVTCTQAEDCDLTRGLRLACWYNVNKCKCQNTFSSDFNLQFENGQCLMSKYGPCGVKGQLAVGCRDGFTCIDNQCRDPVNKSPNAVKYTPYPFLESSCTNDGCKFSDDLQLSCGYLPDHCVCKRPYIADASSPFWDIRSYDGNKNCSVGKFGPCGKKNGIRIDCHGSGISCVNGICLDPKHPISEVNESCASKKNCREGLLCSLDNVCIKRFSLPVGKICGASDHCLKELQCSRAPDAGPWSFAFCREKVPVPKI